MLVWMGDFNYRIQGRRDAVVSTIRRFVLKGDQAALQQLLAAMQGVERAATADQEAADAAAAEAEQEQAALVSNIDPTANATSPIWQIARAEAAGWSCFKVLLVSCHYD